jgi:hypothetical protein
MEDRKWRSSILGGGAAMGWLLLLVRNFLVWVDRLSEKSILTAVSGLEGLLLQPRETLAAREFTIGPARKFVTALLLLLVNVLLGSWVLTLGIFLAELLAFNPGLLAKPVVIFLLLFWLSLAGLLAGSLAWMGRALRGGRMVWTSRGVELHRRGTVVYCPWALFNTPGQPFRPGLERVVLPVAAPAVAAVEARHHGKLFAEGLHVRTPQLTFRSGGEAVLAALYEVNTLELAKVLLHLGRVLGPEAPAAPAKPAPGEEESPLSGPGKGGWLTVNLTRLVFPPRCCACGMATTGRQKFRSSEPWFSLGRFLRLTRREAVHIWVPVCYPCQTANRAKLRRAVFTGIGLSMLAMLLTALGTCLMSNNLFLALCFIFAVLLGPFLGGMIGYRIGQAQASPVQLCDYSPARGTVALRFRREEYGPEVRKAMQS